MKILKKLSIIDWALCALGAYIIWRTDFSHVVLEDVLYLSTFGLWFIMLIIRLVIQTKKENGTWLW